MKVRGKKKKRSGASSEADERERQLAEDEGEDFEFEIDETRLAANLQTYLQKHGGKTDTNADPAVSALFRDGLKSQKRAKHWREFVLAISDATGLSIDELEELADDSRVLKPEEAKVWDAFIALKLKPEEVANIVKNHDDLKTRVAKAERANGIATAAKVSHYNSDALSRLLDADSLQIETRPVPSGEEGKGDVDRAFVYKLDKDGKKTDEILLTEYANKNWSAFKASLQSDNESGDEEEGVTFVKQPPSDSGGKNKGKETVVAARNYLSGAYGTSKEKTT